MKKNLSLAILLLLLTSCVETVVVGTVATGAFFVGEKS
jgi:hypothetical protein